MLRSSALAVLMFLGGCAVDVGSTAPPEGSAAALEGTVGVLEIDRRVEDEGALLTAAFARYQGLAEQDVVTLVSSGARADLDACTVVEGDVRLPVEADVQLVDVGAIDVRLEGVGTATQTSHLVARTFPDVANVMAGVFYAGEAQLPLPRAERDAYVVRASGGEDIGAFTVSVAAPAEVAVLVYGDEAGRVARDRPLDFSWTPGAAVHGMGDVIELELASRGGTIVCTAADDGAFRIEPAMLSQLAVDQDAELVVRRVRMHAFDAPGLDSAFARVAITRSSRVSIR
jgi:hypothetical protein